MNANKDFAKESNFIFRKYTDKEISIVLSRMVIVIDSREKKVSHITNIFNESNIKYKKQKLHFADYSFTVPAIPELDIHEEISFENHISIERKNSLTEIAGSFTSTRRQFKNEFERHQGLMILLIEDDTYADIFNHNYRSKLTPQSFIGSLHAWNIKFGVPFIFVPKSHSAQYIYFTFYYYLKYILEEGG